MRRFIVTSLAIPFALLVALGPVAADTTPGGNGTNFFSFSTTCSTGGGRQVCTDTNLQVGPDEAGNPTTCLNLQTYSVSTRRFTFISEQFGCAPTVGLTVGSDYSVALAPTDISLQTCAAHKRQCSGSSIVTVSASDSVVGDVAITTTRSTTAIGGCTYRTTVNETSAELAGTITVNGSSLDEQGFLDIFDSTTTVHCK